MKQYVIKIACDDKGTSLFTDLLNFSKIVKGVSKIKTVGGGGGGWWAQMEGYGQTTLYIEHYKLIIVHGDSQLLATYSHYFMYV